MDGSLCRLCGGDKTRDITQSGLHMSLIISLFTPFVSPFADNLFIFNTIMNMHAKLHTLKLCMTICDRY